MTATDPQASPVGDWTTNSEGRANASAKFLHLKDRIAQLINNDTGYILALGRADSLAGLILAQLAHVHHLIPEDQISMAAEGLTLAQELHAIEKALDSQPVSLVFTSPLVARVMDLVADRDNRYDAGNELRNIDTVLHHSGYQPIHNTTTRSNIIDAICTRAAEADRLESKWRSVLDDEQAESRVFVRIRDIIGATDVPDDWDLQTAHDKNVPVEPATPERSLKTVLMWAYTEWTAWLMMAKIGRYRVAIERIRQAAEGTLQDDGPRT